MRRFRSMLLLMSAVFFLVSCEKDDHENNEEELITTMKLTFVQPGLQPLVFTFKDVDGPGGMAPSVFDPIIINANSIYGVSLQLLNESVTPAEDITLEVKEEGDEHQIYYETSGVSITVSDLDKDSKNLPLGLTSKWTTGAVGTGKIKITLKHKPGSKAANDPVTKGETDIELEFNVQLK